MIISHPCIEANTEERTDCIRRSGVTLQFSVKQKEKMRNCIKFLELNFPFSAVQSLMFVVS